MSQACELTIETALSDPIVMDVMAADHVDPKELSDLLYRIAGVVSSRSGRGRMELRKEIHVSGLPAGGMTSESAPWFRRRARRPPRSRSRRANMPSASTPGDSRLITPETNTTAIATRYDKLVRNFLPVLQLVAAIISN
jgi:hypothetical protein